MAGRVGVPGVRVHQVDSVTAAVMDRSAERMRSAAFALSSRGSSSECAWHRRGRTHAVHVHVDEPRSSRTRKSTCTPAPP